MDRTLDRWAKRLSWKETAEAFRTFWDKSSTRSNMSSPWGLEHRTLGQIDAIGIDEIQYSKGHKYLTLVYQIDAIPHRTHEEDRPFAPQSSRTHPEDFRAQKMLSSGVVEGLNDKAEVTMKKSYGFRTYRVLELTLYHSLGKLPEPESTHDFF